MRRFKTSLLLCFGSMALAWLPTLTARAQSSQSARPDTWYLENSMMTLDTASRFLGSSLVSNPGSVPVYVRASIEGVSVVNGERRRFPVQDGSLRVYPEEFVLRPGDSFTARLISDPSKIAGSSQSYYVKFSDISNTRSDVKNSGLQTAYLLAFEALVSVNKTTAARLSAEQFSLIRQDNNYLLKNLSGRHLYLDRGGLCPASKPLLVDCKTFVNFPRQSLMPNETVKFPASADDNAYPYVGILVMAGLNQRDRADSVYLPTVSTR